MAAMMFDDEPDYFLDDHGFDEDIYPDRRKSSSDRSAPAPSDGGGSDSGVGCFGRFLIIALVLTLTSVIVIRYFLPEAMGERMVAYVVNVERRGAVFKTYEAEIVLPARVADTAAMYTHPQSVTIANEQLARRLQAIEQSGRKVELRYNRFNATLPWRGDSKIVVTGAEIEGE